MQKGDIGSTILGIFIQPIDSTWHFFKGIYYFFESPRKFFWGNIKDDWRKDDTKDREDSENFMKQSVEQRYTRVFTATTSLGRIFAVGAIALCVLGFIGALAVPIPGVAPLYLAGLSAGAQAAGIAQAIGITYAWSLLAKLGGSLLGANIDSYKIRTSYDKNKAGIETSQKSPKKTATLSNSATSTNKIWKACLREACELSLKGESLYYRELPEKPNEKAAAAKAKEMAAEEKAAEAAEAAKTNVKAAGNESGLENSDIISIIGGISYNQEQESLSYHSDVESQTSKKTSIKPNQ